MNGNMIAKKKESRLLALLTKKEKREPVKHVSTSAELSTKEEDIRYKVGEVYWDAE